MKIKKIYIGIKSLDASLKEAGGVFTQLAKGKKIKPKSAVYFSNLKEMRRALTERRLELLKTIKDERPSSVYQLSKLLNRRFPSWLNIVETHILKPRNSNRRNITSTAPKRMGLFFIF